MAKGEGKSDEAVEISSQSPARPTVIPPPIPASSQVGCPALRIEISRGPCARDDWLCAGDVKLSGSTPGAAEVVTAIAAPAAT